MFNHITIGSRSPKVLNAIIEIPTHSGNKYEYDEKLGVIKLDRVLHSPMHYPVDYGFIPETLCGDGDHIDVMVITNAPVFPGCLLEVRPIGAMIMRDDAGDDEKILAVPAHHPYYHHIKRLNHVSPHLLNEIVHFFQEYKALEEKKSGKVKIDGWVGRLQAYKLIRESQKRYKESLKK